MHASQALIPLSTAAGWLGQSCFFARFFVQWLASERARRSVVPPAFWWLSLAGSLLSFGYALWRGESLLLVGFVVGALVAVRNLRLAAGRASRLAPERVALLGFAMLLVLLAVELRDPESAPPGWLVASTLGQILWIGRFPLQWYLAERSGRREFPPLFWWVSLAGNLLLLAYALWLRDPIFVLGYLPGPLLQARNLILWKRTPGPAQA